MSDCGSEAGGILSSHLRGCEGQESLVGGFGLVVKFWWVWLPLFCMVLPGKDVGHWLWAFGLLHVFWRANMWRCDGRNKAEVGC